MGMLQETTSEAGDNERTTGTVPANTNTKSAPDVAAGGHAYAGLIDMIGQVDLARERLSALRQLADAQQNRTLGFLEQLDAFGAGLTETAAKWPDVKLQLAAAAVETIARVSDGDAPAIIVRRSIGEAINRGDLRPGQTLPGQDIILGTVWEPTNRAGERLGRKIASFAAPENLRGYPGTFDQNIAMIGSLDNWHGHDGWEFDRQRSGTSSYENARFKGYQDGSALGLWGSPEVPLINGKDRDGNVVSPTENMLVLNSDFKSVFKNFVTSGSDGAEWSQSCTEHRDDPANVRSVRFPDGLVGWDYKVLNRSCVRPVVALELNHLIL